MFNRLFIHTFFSFVYAVLLLSSHSIANQEHTVCVESIRNDPCSGIVYIKFSGNDDYRLHIRAYPEAPDFIDKEFFNILKDNQSALYPLKGGVEYPIHLAEEYFNQSNIIIIERMMSNTDIRFGYLELLRQSENDLLKRYNFHKPGGYTILGRNTMSFLCTAKVTYSQQQISVPLSEPFPDLKKYYSHSNEPPEVKEAVALVKFIWDGPIKIGPTNHWAPTVECPLRRLELLRSGHWSVSCAGISHIFINLAANSEIISQARFIGAYQKGPSWNDLILHSHALAEFYSKTLEKWIMIDPWFGALFMKDGTYLSSYEIISMDTEQRQEIEIINFIQTPLPFPFNPKPKECPIGNYWNYFGSITIGPAE